MSRQDAPTPRRRSIQTTPKPARRAGAQPRKATKPQGVAPKAKVAKLRVAGGSKKKVVRRAGAQPRKATVKAPRVASAAKAKVTKLRVAGGANKKVVRRAGTVVKAAKKTVSRSAGIAKQLPKPMTWDGMVGGGAVDPHCPVHGVRARAGGRAAGWDPQCPLHGVRRIGGAGNVQGGGITDTCIGGVKAGLACGFNFRDASKKAEALIRIKKIAFALIQEAEDGCYKTNELNTALKAAAESLRNAANAYESKN